MGVLNIKDGFKGHSHFVPDDNHIPFYLSKSRDGPPVHKTHDVPTDTNLHSQSLFLFSSLFPTLFLSLSLSLSLSLTLSRARGHKVMCTQTHSPFHRMNSRISDQITPFSHLLSQQTHTLTTFTRLWERQSHTER